MKISHFLATAALIVSINHSPAALASEKQEQNSQQWQGQKYKSNAALQLKWAEKFFFARQHLKGDEKILDIGSGVGDITERLAELVPHGEVVGIDISNSMLEKAMADHSKKPNLVFLNKDAQDSSFYHQYPNHFHVVTSFSTLHWVSNQEAVLQGIYHVLKPGGKFYLKLASKGGDPIQEIADKLKQSPKYLGAFAKFQDPMKRYSPEEYRHLIQKAKLKVISIEDVEEQDRLEGVEKLTTQLKSWLPHYHYLQKHFPELAESFLSEITTQYLEKHKAANNGDIILKDHYLEVIGEKR